MDKIKLAKMKISIVYCNFISGPLASCDMSFAINGELLVGIVTLKF